MSGIKDVAKLAGVSISTVSNVLNGSRFVSPELTARVQQAVKELHYEVNPIARGMKNNKIGTIGVITEDICGVFYPYVLRGINAVAVEKGYQVIICDAQGIYGDKSAFKREKSLFKRLLASRVDGIIFASTVSRKESRAYFDHIRDLVSGTKKRIPLVSLERDFTEAGIDSVYFDGFGNSRMAVQHLIDCGCRRICHITGPSDMEIVKERIEGYKSALREAGPDFEKNTLIVNGDYTHKSGYTCMKQILSEMPDVDGVFVGNDQMAVGALKYVREKGISVPDSIRIMGYDDVFLSSVMEPALSTIHIQKYHAGYEAARILFERIDAPDDAFVPKGIEMESRLVVRKSTVADAPDDWDLVDW